MQNRCWTVLEKMRCVEMYARGERIAVIAEKLDRTDRAILRYLYSIGVKVGQDNREKKKIERRRAEIRPTPLPRNDQGLPVSLDDERITRARNIKASYQHLQDLVNAYGIERLGTWKGGTPSPDAMLNTTRLTGLNHSPSGCALVDAG